MNKKKSTAAFLAFIAGGFGVHKFYLREPGAGVFYLFILFTMIRVFGMPLSFLLGIFDAIKLLGMSQERFDEKYNSERPRGSRRYRSRHETTRSTRRDERKSSQRERYRYEKTKKRSRKNPFKISGDKKYEDFDLEEAIKDYEQAIIISPDDADIHFNMAAVYSLMEKKEKSFEHLEKAIEMGYKKPEKITELDDFAFLRIQKEFDSFKEQGYKMQRPKGIDAPQGDLLQDDLLLSQLNKLKSLREKGLLSEKEFLYEKEKLMKR